MINIIIHVIVSRAVVNIYFNFLNFQTMFSWEATKCACAGLLSENSNSVAKYSLACICVFVLFANKLAFKRPDFTNF